MFPIGSTSGDDYYRRFDDLTANGKVFEQDITDVTATTTLTPNESDARRTYISTLTTLQTYYRNRPSPSVTTKDALLCQRVVAPSLAPENASSRSAATESREGRVYPPKIFVWDAFNDDVNNYRIEGNELNEDEQASASSIFWDSLCRAERKCRDESTEQGKLLDNLILTLQKFQIVHKIEEKSRSDGVHGRVDFCLWKDEQTISIICETKSTHNLQLPEKAVHCTQKYNTAYESTMRNNGERTTHWSKIGHPIGQLIYYMMDNKRRYGALTSATKTYFIRAENNKEGSKIMISDAWYTGQANYLRAWAYVHSLGCSNKGKWNPPKNWFKTETTNTTPNACEEWNAKVRRKKDDPDNNTGADNENNSPLKKRLRSSNSRTGRNHSIEYSCPIQQQIPLPHVPFDDIIVIDVIGSGRNGSCFRVKWNGQEYAMKQFDIGRVGWKDYNNEILAYMLLRDAWGILVPRPIFLSESTSGFIKYIGLQLGREPNDKDDLSNFSHVLFRIQKEYGIQHNDAEGRNMIFLPDPNCTGGERIVAIDFEDWEVVRSENNQK